MNYSAQLEQVLGVAQNIADAKSASQSRREAEINKTADQIVAVKLELKACRGLEDQALKALKGAERVVTVLKDEYKAASNLASHSQEAIGREKVVSNLLTQVEGLRGEESKILAQEDRAKKLGVVAEFESVLRACKGDLTQKAQWLDKAWVDWNKTVKERAKALLDATKWHSRMYTAHRAVTQARSAWLISKGAVKQTLEKRAHLERRLEKLINN